MKIGFFLDWKSGTLEKQHKTFVLGEEILALGLCNELKKIKEVETAEVFAPNHLPSEQLDVMIYMNYITSPDRNLAKKSICYIQNAFEKKGDIPKLYKFVKEKSFDAFFVFSSKILDYLKEQGETAVFLPFAIDTSVYHPVEYDKEFDYDVAYVGNDIKGPARTKKYLYPAKKFNLGLFGYWPYTKTAENVIQSIKTTKRIPDIYDICIILKHLTKNRSYCKELAEISSGKISQENMIKLLSSSKILLNFTLQSAVDYDVINYRILEILACKGFVISDKTKSAQKLLKDCVVFTDGGKDLEKKIEYYLHHPEERRQYAQKGYEYVTKYCTAKAKAEEIYKFAESLIQ